MNVGLLNHIPGHRCVALLNFLVNLLQLLSNVFQGRRAGVGTYQKCMPWQKMPSNILKFGSANNFSENIGERALKGIVKDHADKTQRRPDKFAEHVSYASTRKMISNML
jgi:hypothetical protein